MRDGAWVSMGVLCLIGLLGCGHPSAKVSGTVTCNGKPVTGSILFTPKGEGEANTGPGVPVALKADGTYEIQLTTTGPHNVVVSPVDVKYPVKPGELDFPCSLATKEYDVTSGVNTISIELTRRTP